MRKTVVALALPLALLGELSAESEVSDLMPTIEDVTRSLDSNVAQQNAKAAALEAEQLEALFKQVEARFAQRQDAVEAVGFARQSQAFAAAVAASVQVNDFGAASDAVTSLARSCKTCHNVYK